MRVLDNLLLPLADADNPESIKMALGSIRRHLGMEIAYVSQFIDGRSVFIEVDAPGLEGMIKAGDSNSLDDVYCQHILAGRIPELMANTADHPAAAAMPITQAVPIGAHMSVPVRMPDGEVFGMFCCLSPTPNASLNERDLSVMRVFAEMAAGQLCSRRIAQEQQRDNTARIEQIIADGAFKMVLQPIWQYGAARPSGFEALARFLPLPYRSPDLWFKDAADADCGVQLEVAAMDAALQMLSALPPECYLSVNASPETILSDELPRLLALYPVARIVLEITEQVVIDDYAAIEQALAPLRAAGLRLAVDDAGAGYASFQHILRLAPDMIKLDMRLTRSVDTDLSRRALASAIILFARETGTVVIAEGIETDAEWQTLHALGVQLGQGFFLGRPTDLPTALGLFDR